MPRTLAQKTYLNHVIIKAESRLKQINLILKDYNDDEIENLYFSLNPERQKLIIPIEQIWSQKVEIWRQIPYQGKPFGENVPLILTNSGKRVRSKSEKILADFFDQNNIPFKYECPLFLNPFGIVYPDFTLLSKKTGKEIYWEHEGRMDDSDYARKAVKKIELYQNNNILAGERLILTFETSNCVLNTGTIRKMVEFYGL